MRGFSPGLALARLSEAPRSGDYVTDGTSLYCVEKVFGDHALLEDCRTLVLIDVDLGRLRMLEPVRASSDGDREAGAAVERPGGVGGERRSAGA